MNCSEREGMGGGFEYMYATFCDFIFLFPLPSINVLDFTIR